MHRAHLASMLASSALFLAACGGLTDQTSSREGASGDPSAPGRTGAGGGNAAAPAAPTTERVADDVGVPSAIAVASDRIVFTTEKTKLHGELRDASGLFVVHKRLGPALLLAMDDKGSRYEALAVDATHAYVATSDARLVRVPLEGGAATAIAELAAPAAAIAPAGNHVYVATVGGVVERVPADGVGALEPVATVAGKPRAISVDDRGAVYVATSVTEGEGGSIVKITADAADPTVLTTSAASPCAMTRDGHELYFTAESAVHRLLVEGGPAATVAAGASSACAIATDGKDLWFAGGAGLMRAPSAGGQPEAVAAAKKARATPGAVAVDASHVYWLDSTAVLRLAKPLR